MLRVHYGQKAVAGQPGTAGRQGEHHSWRPKQGGGRSSVMNSPVAPPLSSLQGCQGQRLQPPCPVLLPPLTSWSGEGKVTQNRHLPDRAIRQEEPGAPNAQGQGSAIPGVSTVSPGCPHLADAGLLLVTHGIPSFLPEPSAHPLPLLALPVSNPQPPCQPSLPFQTSALLSN